LFKSFVSDNRPSVDIQKVANGDVWFGQRAKDVNLVDELKTSDEYVLDCTETELILTKRHQNSWRVT